MAIDVPGLVFVGERQSASRIVMADARRREMRGGQREISC